MLKLKILFPLKHIAAQWWLEIERCMQLVAKSILLAFAAALPLNHASADTYVCRGLWIEQSKHWSRNEHLLKAIKDLLLYSSPHPMVIFDMSCLPLQL